MQPVAVLIPNWNGAALLDRLLPTLAAQSLAPARVLVVDNGSTDNSRDCAARHGAGVLALGRNQGFAAAVNQGVASVSEPIIAILNNDVELAPDWLLMLRNALDETGAEFACGKIYRLHQENVLDGTFDLLAASGCALRCGSGLPDSEPWNRRRAIRFAPLTAALFQREAFHTIGGLDEDFGSYLEDVELGLRCARAGMRGVYEPRAVAKHWGSATLGVWRAETVHLIARNQVLLLAKHYPRDWIRHYGWPVLAGQLLWGLVALKHRSGLAFVKGKWAGVRAARVHRRKLDEGHSISTSKSAESKVGLDEILRDNEAQILELQRATGFDWYWRAYFALAGGSRR